MDYDEMFVTEMFGFDEIPIEFNNYDQPEPDEDEEGATC